MRIYPTPDICFYLLKNQNPIMTETGKSGNINLSQIITFLIQNTGRFTERFASDLLFNLKHLERLTEPHPVEKTETSVILYGLRTNGVDHTAYILNRLQDSCHAYTIYTRQENHYRKLYATEITTHPDQSCTVALYDLTNASIPANRLPKHIDDDEIIKAHTHRLNPTDDPSVCIEIV